VGPDPRTAVLDRAKERVGAVLRDKWRLDALLGVGGMASVYAATHRNGKRVAIKILHPEFCAQPQFVTRFLREGYVANKIEHPAAVQVLDDDGTQEGTVFLVMDLLDGSSLERFTRRGGTRLPLESILRIGYEVLDLLAAAHAKGIVHRDVKPANIMVTAGGTVKVLDFGIARLTERALDGSSTQTGAAMGTPAYMPPEQARGRWNLVDVRTDLWAMGATMFALVVGDRPRRAETVQEELLLAMTTPLPSLAVAAPGTPPALVAFVDRAVAMEMGARWPDAKTMQSAVRDMIHAGQIHGLPQTLAPAMPVSADGAHGHESPSHPSTPRPDTAPVVVGGRRVPATDPPTQLTTGGTMGGGTLGGGKSPSHARRRAVAAVLVLGGVLGALAFGAWFWVRTPAMRETPASAAGALGGPPPVTQTLPAAPTVTPTATPPLSTSPSPAGVAPLPPATTKAVPTASVAQPTSTSRPVSSGHKPKPTAPAATPADTPPANPLDQRF
jgi:serine/threonine protein kinase